MLLRTLALCLAFALPAQGEEVVAELSQTNVSITTNFTGSEILIFGAVKRTAPIPDDSDLHVIITVAGPSEPVTIRRKSRVAGIWVNTAAADIDAAPSFYAVASTGPLEDVLTQTDDLRHKISATRLIRAIDTGDAASELDSFTAALLRIRAEDGLFQQLEGDVRLTDDTLFSAEVSLPANLTEGDYATRVFLTREGQVIDSFDTVIDVRKVGLERFLYNLAHDKPLVYGLMSLAIAIAAGWGAAAFFRYVRG
ncbi:MAG: TIGR02186 family protein [Dinoroseobacter sp.]|nr:TIGR02186 family protein [Dinoroseobacter sp.]MDJ0995382.1 TIGR02186 family protein [Dinoroseobacter sp.]